MKKLAPKGRLFSDLSLFHSLVRSPATRLGSLFEACVMALVSKWTIDSSGLVNNRSIRHLFAAHQVYNGAHLPFADRGNIQHLHEPCHAVEAGESKRKVLAEISSRSLRVVLRNFFHRVERADGDVVVHPESRLRACPRGFSSELPSFFRDLLEVSTCNSSVAGIFIAEDNDWLLHVFHVALQTRVSSFNRLI